jgi:ubiquinone/menaquinone biosynthesis C-methylase UbiE
VAAGNANINAEKSEQLMYTDKTYEQQAATAFSAQAPAFDLLYDTDATIIYKRKRVRDHIHQYLQPSSSMLELNAGTGTDACYFAALGHTIHATDISASMLHQLRHKAAAAALTNQISSEVCSFSQLSTLQHKGPFQYVYSNFAGLNCTNELPQVLESLDALVAPGGVVTLVILPRFCLWEWLLMFRGHFREAFRRWSGKKGAAATINGADFRCWYYSPDFIKKKMPGSFVHLHTEGLSVLTPPSFIQGFPLRHPGIWKLLVRIEETLARRWPFNRMGDYYMISFCKK